MESILNPSKGQKVGATEVLRDYDTEQCLWNVGVCVDLGSPRWVKATNWMTAWVGGSQRGLGDIMPDTVWASSPKAWGFLRIYSEQQGEDEWAKKGK